MAKISEERKSYILEQMLPPYNLSVSELSRKEGISAGTLYYWRKQLKLSGTLMPGNKPTTEQWSNADKLQVIIETANLTECKLSEYCRSKGLYKEQIAQWKDEFTNIPPVEKTLTRKEEKLIRAENKQLKRELRRKEKALAETAALLVLRKKLNALYGEEPDEEL